MTTFFLMRHGLTGWNAEKRIQGQTDTELCDAGRVMAGAWAASLADLEVNAVLTSGLKRAEETASIVTAGRDLPRHADFRLAEQDWGEWTGLTGPELLRRADELHRQERRGFGFRAPGGESREEVLCRACDALTGFAATNPGGRVLVVTHQGVLQCLLYALSGLEFLPTDPPLATGYRLHRVECFEGSLALGAADLEL